MKLIEINQILPLRIEYNAWNGFSCTIIGIELQGNKKGFEGELFGLHFSKDYLLIYIFFISFEIKSPFV